jgi:hypothetical protein
MTGLLVEMVVSFLVRGISSLSTFRAVIIEGSESNEG